MPPATGSLRLDRLRLDIVSDVICPWCYIGKRHLEQAMPELERDGIRLDVHWNPFQLNPDMPQGGVERRTYRIAKFGSEARSRELDAQVSAAGEAAGLTFRYDLQSRTPNTIAAHRLLAFAARRGVQDATAETLFRAYFCEGQDIGQAAVLANLAAGAGLDPDAVAGLLAGQDGEAEIVAAEGAARRAGVSGVPSFFLEGHYLFSGAVPAATMAQALRRARDILASAPAAA